MHREGLGSICMLVISASIITGLKQVRCRFLSASNHAVCSQLRTGTHGNGGGTDADVKTALLEASSSMCGVLILESGLWILSRGAELYGESDQLLALQPWNTDPSVEKRDDWGYVHLIRHDEEYVWLPVAGKLRGCDGGSYVSSVFGMSVYGGNIDLECRWCWSRRAGHWGESVSSLCVVYNVDEARSGNWRSSSGGLGA